MTSSGKREFQVRAILALLLTLGATAGFFMTLIPYDAYMPLVVMAISWYFAKANEDDKSKPSEPPVS